MRSTFEKMTIEKICVYAAISYFSWQVQRDLFGNT